MSNPFYKEPEPWRVKMKENKPTFEEYCNQPAYPQPIYASDDVTYVTAEYNRAYAGLTRLEAFTMAAMQGVVSRIDTIANETQYKEGVVGCVKATLKALYDEQYGKGE